MAALWMRLIDFFICTNEVGHENSDLLGSGGREHALAWKCAQDPRVETVFVAPGNAGSATEAKCENVALDILNNDQLVQFAQDKAST
jgi:phosphoribosylamine--glycine ligase